MKGKESSLQLTVSLHVLHTVPGWEVHTPFPSPNLVKTGNMAYATDIVTPDPV